MDVFNNPSPFGSGGLLFNRLFILQKNEQDRIEDSSSKLKTTSLGSIMANEPQLVQRLTENMVLLEDMETIQKSPFRISTEAKNLNITKGRYLLDTVTSKTYRIIAYYEHRLGYDFTVTELND